MQFCRVTKGGDDFEVATSKGEERIRVSVPNGASAGDIITIRVTSRHVLTSWAHAPRPPAAGGDTEGRSPYGAADAGQARAVMADQMVTHMERQEEKLRAIFTATESVKAPRPRCHLSYHLRYHTATTALSPRSRPESR